MSHCPLCFRLRRKDGVHICVPGIAPGSDLARCRWTLSPADRFFEKVSPEPNTGCWLWTAAVNEWGYGVLWWEGRMRRAHHVSFELAGGELLRGQILRHRCDTPCCVNDAHLLAGTHADNARDREERGRGVRPRPSRLGSQLELGRLLELLGWRSA